MWNYAAVNHLEINFKVVSVSGDFWILKTVDDLCEKFWSRSGPTKGGASSQPSGMQTYWHSGHILRNHLFSQGINFRGSILISSLLEQLTKYWPIQCVFVFALKVIPSVKIRDFVANLNSRKHVQNIFSHMTSLISRTASWEILIFRHV